MKCSFSLKTWPWFSFRKPPEKAEKGAVTPVSIFVLLMFTVLAMSLLQLSQIYLKFSGFRKHSTVLEYASENGIKQGFAHLTELLSRTPSLRVLPPDRMEALKKNTEAGELELIEHALEERFPLTIQDSRGHMTWRSTVSLALDRIEDRGSHFFAVYRVHIHSEGMLENFRPRRKSLLEASLGVLAGHIPLPHISFLLDKRMDPDQKTRFLSENAGIFSPEKTYLDPQISISDADLLPVDILPLLGKALKIKVFDPQGLSTPLLRSALGLEESNEPVPPGVYLIEDDLGLGGVFVEGDLEEMVLAVEEDSQVISFQNSGERWLLKFSPANGSTVFSTPAETSFYNFVPRGIIFVRGKILSLGGGTVSPSGEVLLQGEGEEAPSILRGVNLTIVSPDEMTISSHLIRQGTTWQDGIPYVKDNQSQLIIYTAGKDPLDGAEKEGKIVIGKDSPRDIKIQASLAARGKGLSVEGEGKTVRLLGSLQVSDFFPGENSLTITPEAIPLSGPRDSPETEEPVLYISFLKVLKWEDY